jgi:hypothetical protein
MKRNDRRVLFQEWRYGYRRGNGAFDEAREVHVTEQTEDGTRIGNPEDLDILQPVDCAFDSAVEALQSKARETCTVGRMMFNEKSGTVARERTNGHLKFADGFGGPRARDDGFAAIDDLVELEQRYGSVYASQANCVDLASSST